MCECQEGAVHRSGGWHGAQWTSFVSCSRRPGSSYAAGIPDIRILYGYYPSGRPYTALPGQIPNLLARCPRQSSNTYAWCAQCHHAAPCCCCCSQLWGPFGTAHTRLQPAPPSPPVLPQRAEEATTCFLCPAALHRDRRTARPTHDGGGAGVTLCTRAVRGADSLAAMAGPQPLLLAEGGWCILCDGRGGWCEGGGGFAVGGCDVRWSRGRGWTNPIQTPVGHCAVSGVAAGGRACGVVDVPRSGRTCM